MNCRSKDRVRWAAGLNVTAFRRLASSSGRALFLIEEGECKVVTSEKPGAPDIVRATLVAGDYFGGHTLITERCWDAKSSDFSSAQVPTSWPQKGSLAIYCCQVSMRSPRSWQLGGSSLGWREDPEDSDGCTVCRYRHVYMYTPF